MRPSHACALSCLLVLAGCSDDATETSAPTYHRDVAPVLQASCQGCHVDGGIAPFALDTYADARATAPMIAAQTRARTMPPFLAQDTDECKVDHPIRDDLRLSDATISMFEAWLNAGTPEGDIAEAPAALAPKKLEIENPDAEVEPEKTFVSSGSKDQFRCFVLDPGLTETKYLQRSQFSPGNPKVVHHALMFADPSGESLAMADADGAYDCFGGPGITNTGLVGAWVPGALPVELGPDVGIALEAGTLLVMQVHYHPGGTTHEPDSTKFQMVFTEKEPEYVGLIALIGNFASPDDQGGELLPGPNDGGNVEFVIPANAADHTESMRFELPKVLGGAEVPDLYVNGAATHMHYIGTDMKIVLERAAPQAGEPAKECVVQTPGWDFNWQRAYVYDRPQTELPRFRPGDTLDLRCTYDNTLDNPFVKKALADAGEMAPIDVKLGEETLDEMCLAGLLVSWKR